MTVSLDMKELLAEASKNTGLNDFGDPSFEVGLEQILKTYDSNNLTDDGKKSSRDRLLNLLQVRLNIEDAWKRHPEILEEEVKAPMFITGMPRTGTSALVNLLARDSASRPMKMWEGHFPYPLPGNPPEQEDPRFLAMKAAMDERNRDPAMTAIHFAVADGPEECIHLTNHTFIDVQFGVQCYMEPYATFFRQVDRRPIYKYHHNLLRMLQWQRPGDRWLLKAPYHLWSLDTVVEEYPDCSIMITHRNPLEVVGSYCSMMEAIMPEREGLDRVDLGERVFTYLADQVELSMKVRQSIDPARVLDIQFRDFLATPMNSVEQIYGHFNLPMSDQTRKSFSDYIAEHQAGKHGKHDYKLADYGLTEQQVLDRFADYINTYNIAM